MKVIKNNLSILLVTLLAALLIGCTQNAGNTTSNHPETEPNENAIPELEEPEEITITIMLPWQMSGARVEEAYIGATEEAFPHITIERIEAGAGSTTDLEETFAAGINPDIVMLNHPSHVHNLREFEIDFDMSELIDQNNFDLTRYDDDYLAEWLSWTGGEMLALPFHASKYALHYNKDIFDMFGEAYPTSGMTWDEVLDLAIRLTREEDGVSYHGIHMKHDARNTMAQLMGDALYIDPETDEVLWTERQEVRDYLALVDRTRSIPGIDLDIETDYIDFIDAFQVERNLAMLPHSFLEATHADLNWDIVTYPVWPERPGTQPNQGGWALAITDISEHKDTAFELLEFWYSDEMMLQIGNSAAITPFRHLYESGAVHERLRADENRPHLADKNIEALFEHSPGGGTSETRSHYDAGAHNRMGSLGNDFWESELDINAFLDVVRQEEEQRIEEERTMR